MGTDIELYKAAIEAGTKSFIETVAGPAVEIGDWLRDAVRFRRWKTQVRTLQRAQEFLEARGIQPSSVSLKTLVPLIDAAGLENDDHEEMQDRWASLLANAAAGQHANVEVIPSYVAILRELSAVEAAVLDALYASAIPDDRKFFRTWPVDVAAIRQRLGLEESVFAVYART